MYQDSKRNGDRMKRFLKGFLCGMLTTSMMLVVALTVGQFSGYIDLGAAWNRTDQDSTMKREVKQKASTIEKYIDAYYFCLLYTSPSPRD